MVNFTEITNCRLPRTAVLYHFNNCHLCLAEMLDDDDDEVDSNRNDNELNGGEVA